RSLRTYDDSHHKLCVTRVQAIGDSGVVGLNDCVLHAGSGLALAGHLGHGGGEATSLGLRQLAPGCRSEFEFLLRATGLDGQRTGLLADVRQLLLGQGTQSDQPVTGLGEGHADALLLTTRDEVHHAGCRDEVGREPDHASLFVQLVPVGEGPGVLPGVAFAPLAVYPGLARRLEYGLAGHVRGLEEASDIVLGLVDQLVRLVLEQPAELGLLGLGTGGLGDLQDLGHDGRILVGHGGHGAQGVGQGLLVRGQGVLFALLSTAIEEQGWALTLPVFLLFGHFGLLALFEGVGGLLGRCFRTDARQGRT
ncbi:MAG: hypothetical protein UU63_C0059G0006, partial [Candidatus Uhrbacteria bacterium GW2011_GWF2_41_430]